MHTLELENDQLAGALAVVWTEVAGTHPDPADHGQAEATGAALALLDMALAAVDPTTLPGRATLPLRDLRRRVSAPDDIEAALLQLPLPAEDTASLMDQLRVAETQIPLLYASLPQQLVHADIGPSNILVDGEQVTGVLDFEFAHSDLRIADLLVPLSWWRPELFGTGAEWDIMEALGRAIPPTCRCCRERRRRCRCSFVCGRSGGCCATSPGTGRGAPASSASWSAQRTRSCASAGCSEMNLACSRWRIGGRRRARRLARTRETMQTAEPEQGAGELEQPQKVGAVLVIA